MLKSRKLDEVVILNRFQEQISACLTPEEADQTLKEALSSLGIDQFIYVYYSKKLPKDDDVLHVTYSDGKKAWFEYVHAQGFHKLPSVGMRVFKSLCPIVLNLDDVRKTSLFPGMRKFAAAAADKYDIHGAAIYTLFGSKGGVAALLIYRDDIAALLEEHKYLRMVLNQVGLYYHYHVSNLTQNLCNVGESLTKREIECLAWTARHKSVAEIAKLISRTERTVNFHLSNVNKKLKTKNKYQAAAKALALGLIEI